MTAIDQAFKDGVRAERQRWDKLIDEAREAEKIQFQYLSFQLVRKLAKKKKSGEK